MQKNLSWQSDCIVANPRIYTGEAIQVLLRKIFVINVAIVSLQIQKLLALSDTIITLI
jgi:hypothetical protein